MTRYKRVVLRCGACGAEYEREFVTKCRHCGGVTDPVYDLTTARILDDGDSLERHFDILPLESSDSAHGGCAPTPVLHARTLGRRLGLGRLYLKDETGHPTRTTKDRMAACVMSRFAELEIEEFVTSSTGNSSTAFAYWIKTYGEGAFHAHLFCGSEWAHRHQHVDHDGVTLHVIDGTFVEAATAGRAFAVEHGLPFEGGFFNPARRDGLKLAYLEAFDVMPREPTVVVQAVSSGMGLYGAASGIAQYRRLGRMRNSPRLVCVQQSTCAPMVRSFEAGATEMVPEFIVDRPHGIAEAILRGDPTGSYPHMCKLVRASGGTFAAVERDAIEEAQAMLLLDEGVEACPASSAAVAAVLKLAHAGWMTEDDVVLVNVAGGVRAPEAAGVAVVAADPAVQGSP